MQELGAKAKAGTIQPAEFIGGSFTISNLGMFGVQQFSAVINLPQVAILAVGGSTSRLNVVTNDKGETSVVASSYMAVQLSSDARAVDQAEAAEWLRAFQGYIEQPMTML